MSEAGGIREWFVLQERMPGGDWHDEMSLHCWHDPAVRAWALVIYRDSESPPGAEYRMARRTESALAE